MNGFLYAALGALGLAGFLLWQHLQERKKHLALVATETSSTGTLRELAGAAATAAGVGAFRQFVEVKGTVHPGPSGPLKAPFSGTECAWYWTRVTHHWREAYTDNDGNRRYRDQSERLQSDRSTEPFTLRDDEGDLLVVPGTNVANARKTVSENRDSEPETSTVKIGKFEFSSSSRQGDSRYQYEEWVLPLQSRLFVQGDATDSDGRLEIRKPEGSRKMVLDTRSEEEVTTESRKHMQLTLGLAAGLIVLAIVLLVVGLLR